LPLPNNPTATAGPTGLRVSNAAALETLRRDKEVCGTKSTLFEPHTLSLPAPMVRRLGDPSGVPLVLRDGWQTPRGPPGGALLLCV